MEFLVLTQAAERGGVFGASAKGDAVRDTWQLLDILHNLSSTWYDITLL